MTPEQIIALLECICRSLLAIVAHMRRLQKELRDSSVA